MQKSLVMMAGWVQFSICRVRGAGTQAQGHPPSALAPGPPSNHCTDCSPDLPGPDVAPHSGGRSLCSPGADSCREIARALPPGAAGGPVSVQGTLRVPDTGLTPLGLRT